MAYSRRLCSRVCACCRAYAFRNNEIFFFVFSATVDWVGGSDGEWVFETDVERRTGKRIANYVIETSFLQFSRLSAQ